MPKDEWQRLKEEEAIRRSKAHYDDLSCDYNAKDSPFSYLENLFTPSRRRGSVRRIERLLLKHDDKSILLKLTKERFLEELRKLLEDGLERSEMNELIKLYLHFNFARLS